MQQPTEDHRWRAPVGVAIDGEDLVYDKKKTYATGGELRPTPGMLVGFIALTEASPDQIAEFAMEYGVLGICAHGEIYTACRTSDDGEHVEAYTDNPSNREPFETWRYYARLASNMLDVSSRLRGPHPPRVKGADIEAIVQYGGYGMFPSVEIAGTVAGARSAVAAGLSRWLKDGDATLRVRWPQGAAEPVLTIGGDSPDAGLFTALGLQLSLACAKAEGMWRCDYCGRLHQRDRAPRRDQRIFCDECRAEGVPLRLAKRDKRARDRQAGEGGKL